MDIPLTLTLIVKDKQVLLGMKKRGFGAGWWNGFGGKIEPGESIDQAAKRELREEVGIIATQLKPRGILKFTFDGKNDVLVVNVFECLEYSGTPVETEEMLPQWFDFDQIPFEKMWPDDKYWVPMFLANKDVSGSVHFDQDNKIVSYEFNSKD